MDVPKAKQISAWIEDRPGTLGKAASALGEKNVNILAFTIPVVGDRGAFHMIVEKPATAKKILAQQGWETTEEDVVLVTLPDKPGSLGRIATKLGQAGVNIEYAYTGTARSAQKVNTYFKVSDLNAALKALR